MIGLPHAYRFTVYNASGVTISTGAAVVYARRRKISGTDGQLVYEASEATLYSNGAGIATATFAVGATVSNATDKYLSGDFVFQVTTTGSPNGDVFLYFERATDGGTTRWPDNGLSAILVKLSFTSAGTKRIDFSF